MLRWMAAILMLLLAGCGPQTPAAQPPPDQPRIISLSPAISRTLVDLKLQHLIVGRTPHCASVDQSIPVVGDLYAMDMELMVKCRPTHVLVQPPASGVDATLSGEADSHGWRLGHWQLNGADDIETMIREIPPLVLEDRVDDLAAATARAAELTNQLAQVMSPGAAAGSPQAFRGKVLLVNSVNPAMAFGQGTYLHDVLVAQGGANACPGAGWVQLSMEDLTRLDPDAIVIVRPGECESISAAEAAGPLMEMDLRAIREGRLAVLRHKDAFLPSSALIEVAAELRAILRHFEDQP